MIFRIYRGGEFQIQNPLMVVPVFFRQMGFVEIDDVQGLFGLTVINEVEDVFFHDGPIQRPRLAQNRQYFIFPILSIPAKGEKAIVEEIRLVHFQAINAEVFGKVVPVVILPVVSFTLIVIADVGFLP